MCVSALLEVHTNYVNSLKDHAVDKLRIRSISDETQTRGSALQDLCTQIAKNDRKELRPQYDKLMGE